MQHVLTDHASNIETYVYWEDAFTDIELNWLQHKARSNIKPGLTGYGTSYVENSDLRRSSVGWISCSDETRWVYNKLGHVVSSLNASFFRFDLAGFGEDLQLSNYDSCKLGTYGWHVDFAPNSPSRKLSIVMQLTDPSEYEGGDLQILDHGGQPINIPKKRGLIAAFPSWTIHQVTQVTSGSRQSLVSWITGPMFK